jgi:hypothetical protein
MAEECLFEGAPFSSIRNHGKQGLLANIVFPIESARVPFLVLEKGAPPLENDPVHGD